MINTPYQLVEELRRLGYKASTSDFGGGIKHVVIPDPQDEHGVDRFIVALDESIDGEQRFVLAIEASGVDDIETMIDNATIGEICETLNELGV